MSDNVTLFALFSPIIMLAIILFNLVLIAGLNAFFEWLFVRFVKKCQSPPPYCDIDPLRHSAFLWGPDGNGYIGDMIVVKRELHR